MFKIYLQNGGESATIQQYYDNGGLKKSHFNDTMTDENFIKYISENGDKDFVNNYIIYC